LHHHHHFTTNNQHNQSQPQHLSPPNPLTQPNNQDHVFLLFQQLFLFQLQLLLFLFLFLLRPKQLLLHTPGHPSKRHCRSRPHLLPPECLFRPFQPQLLRH
ncbi:hypothetical protein QBC40DRAFT_265286, partial [Triangularia verruculosa]